MNILIRYDKLLLKTFLIPVVLVISTLVPSAWGATPRIAAGNGHTVTLRSDGTIWATGDNSAGQLGDGTTTDRTTAVQVGLPDNGASWVAIAAGDDHTLALKADGSLWAWGSNLSGQLGDNSGRSRMKPVRIGNNNDWTAIAAGGSSSFT